MKDGSKTSPRSIVLRVYGENTEKFIDREEEVNMMKVLHSHGFGPQVLGTFQNGRIESFLYMKCLEAEDICKPEYATKIAKTLAKFHSLSGAFGAAKDASTPFARIKEWVEKAKTLDFSDNISNVDNLKKMSLQGILEESDRLAAIVSQLGVPVVMCHNDLLGGNIMVSEGEDQKMTFIDFEYADWAPRGFDLGNHFCEYAGFDGDYSRYPVQPTDFVRAYLEESSGIVVREDQFFATIFLHC